MSNPIYEEFKRADKVNDITEIDNIVEVYIQSNGKYLDLKKLAKKFRNYKKRTKSFLQWPHPNQVCQEIFDTAELIANLDRNAVKVEHSVYDYIVYDSSTIERPFALALDNDPDVKMFFKIPDRFKIDTPIGSYNPDWAVYLTKNGEEKLYFILETKGSDSTQRST